EMCPDDEELGPMRFGVTNTNPESIGRLIRGDYYIDSRPATSRSFFRICTQCIETSWNSSSLRTATCSSVSTEWIRASLFFEGRFRSVW
ncbi:hypothetical protein PENTCL1PPCAC_10498, partial [Pristionchus entomophagus]